MAVRLTKQNNIWSELSISRNSSSFRHFKNGDALAIWNFISFRRCPCFWNQDSLMFNGDKRDGMVHKSMGFLSHNHLGMTSVNTMKGWGVSPQQSWPTRFLYCQSSESVTAQCHSNYYIHLYRSTYIQTGKNNRAYSVYLSRFSVSATKRDENLVVYIFLIYNPVQDALTRFVISISPQSSPKQPYSVRHWLADKILSLVELYTLAVGFTMRLV